MSNQNLSQKLAVTVVEGEIINLDGRLHAVETVRLFLNDGLVFVKITTITGEKFRFEDNELITTTNLKFAA